MHIIIAYKAAETADSTGYAPSIKYVVHDAHLDNDFILQHNVNNCILDGAYYTRYKQQF